MRAMNFSDEPYTMNDGQQDPQRVPKLCGADVELGNFIEGIERPQGTGAEACRAVLREIDGVTHALRSWHGYSPSYYGNAWPGSTLSAYDPQDWGRKFLAGNGGCAYIDLDHIELATPEVISAFDHIAAWHAMLRIARRAMQSANARLPEGQRIHLLVNNSDGHANTYGSHLNFLVTRRTWDNIFNRKLQYQLFLAACQVSSIVFTGQGKVGAENGAPEVRFQLAQRADFFETITAVQTTFERPIVNARDESLCGGRRTDSDNDLARVHSIFFDAGLCHIATLLKVGMMQVILAMIEAERVGLGVVLDDPLDALRRWSHDPGLHARARLTSGSVVTAIELQWMFLEQARRFHAHGGCEGVVPRAAEILDLWEDTLTRLSKRDFDVLARRLDWVLKLRAIQRAIERHPQLDWGSPPIRQLDMNYGNLDEEIGLYWAYERAGLVERLVSEEQIENFVRNPPDDTRAWMRAMMLRWGGAERVHAVDWDSITFRNEGAGYRSEYVKVRLDNPLSFTRARMEHRFPPSMRVPEPTTQQPHERRNGDETARTRV
jgi:Pup amidohydrolase